jgi:quinol monooxygenase YgiN
LHEKAGAEGHEFTTFNVEANMPCMTIGYYYPKPEFKEVFIQGCEKMAVTVREQPGLIDTSVWLDEQNSRLVITSIWESPEHALKARPVIDATGATLPFADWQRQAPERIANLVKVV